MPKIFLSFRRSDTTALAGRIYERLVNRYGGTEVVNDVGYIPSSTEPHDYISKLIERFSVLLLVIGPKWAGAALQDGQRRLDNPEDTVRLEVETALRLGRPIVIVLVRGASVSDPSKLPDSMKTLGALQPKPITFTGDVTFNRDMRALYKELDRILALPEARTPPSHNDGRDPDPARRDVLRKFAHDNIEARRPPFAGVRLDTLGEVNWLLSTRAVDAGVSAKRLTDLSGADLSYTNLSNGTLEGANLSGADLTGAVLINASLREAHLNAATLRDADLTNIHAEAADLSNADLFEAKLDDARLSGAKLNKVNLQGASMQRVELKDADLQGADLSDAILTQANLTGALLTQARLLNATMQTALLETATLDSAELVNADLTGANLTGAHLVSSNLKQSNLTGACLRGSDLTGAKYDETDLSGTNLTGAQLDAAEDILGKIKFGLDVSLDQVAWNGVQERAETKGKNRAQRIAIYRDVARVNRRIATVLRGLSLPTEASKYRLKEQSAQRKILFLERKIGGWLFSWILNITAGYGERLSRTVLSYLIVIVAFATIFFTMTQSLSDLPMHLAWQDAILLSIHSFHGRGFIPSTLGLSDPLAIVATVEAVLGLFLELVFIAMFSRRFLGS